MDNPGLYCNPKLPKNNPKHTKTQQPILKTTKTEIYAKWGPGFYIQLARGGDLPLCPRHLRPWVYSINVSEKNS